MPLPRLFKHRRPLVERIVLSFNVPPELLDKLDVKRLEANIARVRRPQIRASWGLDL